MENVVLNLFQFIIWPCLNLLDWPAGAAGWRCVVRWKNAEFCGVRILTKHVGSWGHPCAITKPNSPQLFRIILSHILISWETSTKAVLIAGNNPEPPDRPLFHLTCCHSLTHSLTLGNPHAREHSESRPSAGIIWSCPIIIALLPHSSSMQHIRLKFSTCCIKLF